MQLELDLDEVALLTRVLEVSLANLREEIGKTENYDMRQDMKRDEEVLKMLIRRLQQTAPA